MFAITARARTMLALSLLAAVSAAVLWTLPLWDRVSGRGDDTDLAGSTTLTMTAVLIVLNAMRERRDRQARVENLAAILPFIGGQLTPHDGDGQDQPQAHWYHYLKRPA